MNLLVHLDAVGNIICWTEIHKVSYAQGITLRAKLKAITRPFNKIRCTHAHPKLYMHLYTQNLVKSLDHLNKEQEYISRAFNAFIKTYASNLSMEYLCSEFRGKISDKHYKYKVTFCLDSFLFV